VSEFVASGISTFDENLMQTVGMNLGADKNRLEWFMQLFRYLLQEYKPNESSHQNQAWL
jgi:hypothetical protein